MPEIVMNEGENEFVGGMVFHRRVKQLVEDAPESEPVTIDLNNLYLDSSVIGTLLAIHTTCHKSGRKLIFTNISKQTHKILELTGLADVLLDDSPDAVSKD